MKTEAQLRDFLKRALTKLDTARALRGAGHDAVAPARSIAVLERRLTRCSDDVLALIQELIGAQMRYAPIPCSR